MFILTGNNNLALKFVLPVQHYLKSGFRTANRACLVGVWYGSHVSGIPKADWSGVKNKQLTAIIIIIIIHEFQSDASPKELQGRCSVTVFSLWLWPMTRTAERPDKQLSLQSAPKTVNSRQRRDRRWQ